jgi:indolepyruvate ferredoxin oxidoreductase beta subunit
MVSSHLRIGTGAHSVLITRYSADLVVALERHEALRGTLDYLKDGGTLVYYDAVWQPLDVRLRRAAQVRNEDIEAEAARKKAKVLRVFKEDLADSRMQNVIVMAELSKAKLIPGVEKEHYIAALSDLLSGRALEVNLKAFEEVSG